jgi:hypothetical protein
MLSSTTILLEWFYEYTINSEERFTLHFFKPKFTQPFLYWLEIKVGLSENNTSRVYVGIEAVFS